MRSSLLGVALTVFTLAASRADAQTVLAFDDTRAYTGAYGYYLTGTGMVAPHSQLLLHGYSVQTTGLITAAALAGADVFFTGNMNPSSTLSASEASALQAWVIAGGSVLYQGEGDSVAAANAQFAALFGAASYGGQYGGSGVIDTITAPTHPVISGPFGTVMTLQGFNSPGRWTAVAPSATVIASNPDASAAVLAFSYGSGRVVFVNDANYFSYPPAYSASHAIFWDNTIDWLEHTVCTGSVASFCTSSTTTHGCVPTLGASGLPSAGAGSGFTLTCTSIEGLASGVIFYGVSGAVALPWAAGSTSFMCVKSPIQRTPVQFSGGTQLACDGTIALDVLAFLAANPIALGAPATPGQAFHAQCWFRDPPAPKTTNLSNGVSFSMCP